MKILLADDERMARVTLRGMITDLGMPTTIYEANNGENFLKKFEFIFPQIAFVDIKMPGMNGLEVIRKAKKISPFTRWVILSGFPEFGFAKEAVELGVFRYLLKPANPAALADILEAAYDEYRRLVLSDNIRFERNMMYLMNRAGSDSKKLIDDRWRNALFHISVLSFDKRGEDPGSRREENALKALRAVLEAQVDENLRAALVVLPDERVFFVCSDATQSPGKDSTRVNVLFRSFDKAVRDLSDDDLALTRTSLSPVLPDGIPAATCRGNPGRIAALRVLLGTGVGHPPRATEAFGPEAVEMCAVFLDGLENLRKKRILQFKAMTEDLLNRHSLRRFAAKPEYRRNMEDIIKIKTGLTLKRASSPEEWIKRLLALETTPTTRKATRYIDEIISYIEENYMHNIGVATIANNLGIGPNYLSALFRKKMKKRFVDYLLEVRIGKAKSLLRETDSLIKEIARKVGYKSSRYFANTFFKSVRCHPSEYRLKYREKSPATNNEDRHQARKSAVAPAEKPTGKNLP